MLIAGGHASSYITQVGGGPLQENGRLLFVFLTFGG